MIWGQVSFSPLSEWVCRQPGRPVASLKKTVTVGSPSLIATRVWQFHWVCTLFLDPSSYSLVFLELLWTLERNLYYFALYACSLPSWNSFVLLLLTCNCSVNRKLKLFSVWSFSQLIIQLNNKLVTMYTSGAQPIWFIKLCKHYQCISTCWSLN